MDRRHWGPVMVIAAAAAITVSGCGSSGGPATTPAPTSATTSGPPSSGPASSDCADVVAKGQSLAMTVTQFVSGSASQGQVSAAAQDLSTTLANARAALAPAAGAHVSDVQNDLGKLVDALKAQPIDVAGVRAAANAAVTDLRDLASVCGTTATAPPTT